MTNEAIAEFFHFFSDECTVGRLLWSVIDAVIKRTPIRCRCFTNDYKHVTFSYPEFRFIVQSEWFIAHIYVLSECAYRWSTTVENFNSANWWRFWVEWIDCMAQKSHSLPQHTMILLLYKYMTLYIQGCDRRHFTIISFI